MGWKLSMILINSEKPFDKNAFFNELGYYQLQEAGNEPFEIALYPPEDRIFIGQYQGNTLVCLQDLPLDSLNESVSVAENLLSTQFPNTDIVTLALHSGFNFWGYSLTRNGKKVRARAGSGDDGTIVEFGEILEEEKALFAQSHVNDEGERIFVLNRFPDHEFTEDQVGENFVFNLSARYLGEKLDACDELLFETELEGYSFSKADPNKPWWQLW